jgi:hypothetical protein
MSPYGCLEPTVTFLAALNLFHTWMAKLFFNLAMVFTLDASSK